MADEYDLQRFETAQATVYDRVTGELRGGRKRTHWMWYIFPQIIGLGISPTSRKFAIKSLEEARAHLDHPVLGARLRECTRIVLTLNGRTAEDIFDTVDSAKFRSSMTLFSCVAGDDPIFKEALDKYFRGSPDSLTLMALPASPLLSLIPAPFYDPIARIKKG